jgi:hypothetical protein
MIKPMRCKIWDNDKRPIFDIKESDQKKLEKKLKDFFGKKIG